MGDPLEMAFRLRLISKALREAARAESDAPNPEQELAAEGKCK